MNKKLGFVKAVKEQGDFWLTEDSLTDKFSDDTFFSLCERTQDECELFTVRSQLVVPSRKFYVGAEARR